MDKDEIYYKTLEFVTKWHGNQKRKYTGEPYVNHLVEVADNTKKYFKSNFDLDFNDYRPDVIGLLHDVLEDTNCKRTDLLDFLFYHIHSRGDFLFYHAVTDLTDHYVSSEFGNRLIRKKMEADRLHKCNHLVQFVKLCEVLSNTQSILEHDKKFAKVYIPENIYLVSGFRDCELKDYVMKILVDVKDKL